MTSIVVDTSALLAIVLGESNAERCINLIAAADGVMISAGTLAEALLIAERRKLRDRLDPLLEGLTLEVAPVTQAAARRVAEATRWWGKGIHPAGLNFGDCFAYVLAKDQGRPLLFVGEDFSKTDILVAV